MKLIVSAFTIFCLCGLAFAQKSAADAFAVADSQDENSLISARLTENLNKAVKPVERERREAAYAKILEGQRYWWYALRLLSPPSSDEAAAPNQSNVKNGLSLFYKSRAAYLAAAEANPFLTEAYIALAEGFFNINPQNLDESLKIVRLAIKLSPDNFSAHQLAARVLTFQSNLRQNDLNAEKTVEAIAEWEEVVSLDPLNAEGYAVLSAFYQKTGETDKRIENLNRWISSNPAVDSSFYRDATGSDDSLAPENARIKLGEVFLETGQFDDALAEFIAAVAENPENTLAVELINEALFSADEKAIKTSLETFRQTVESNPQNPVLSGLLAQMLVKSGDSRAGENILREAVARLDGKDKNTSAEMRIMLGDLLADDERTAEAIEVYRAALEAQNVAESQKISEENLDFAIRVYTKIIRLLKNSENTQAATAEIEKTRKIFGETDSFADRQMIDLLRENGRRVEALQLIRKLRAKNTADVSLLREEATILTETGKVDEGVALIKKSLNQKPARTEFVFQSPTEIKFSSYLFIAGLYAEAKRGAEAVAAANQAYALVEDKELRQIARLTLATAQQSGGDYIAAEKTLREILRENPKNPIALNNLGYFLTERGEKLDEALNLIHKAVRIDPTNPSYLDSLGWAHFKAENFGEAEKYLKSAAKYDSGSATIYEHLGDVYDKQSKNDKARKAWRRALNLATDTEQINHLKTNLK